MESAKITQLDEQMMQLAIDKVREGIQTGQSPFGTVIAKDGKAVAISHNTVWRDTDPTAHAEVNALRAAAKTLKTISLEGCTLYTTCEPCPMCLSAIHWAKVDKVVYGATIADAESAGFSELNISAESMVEQGGSPLKVVKGCLTKECASLFGEWKKLGKGKTY
jgi:tRNA(Arg) A34 adenosine deaminase TadA